jgi:DNA replication ATP-dependent helicase Dna2
MPRLDKEAFSRYLRSNCQRQLRLYMVRQDNPIHKAERRAQHPPIPDPQPPRPGLQLIRNAGDEWARAKLGDLYDAFPAATLVGNAYKDKANRWTYRAMPLADALAEAKSRLAGSLEGCFLVETEFVVGATFKHALNVAHLDRQFKLEYAGLRTDLIEVTSPDGRVAEAVRPDGSLAVLAASDSRLRLAISEIKLQSEPSANYFAEVVLYAMAVSGWLTDRGLDDQYVVVTGGSFIWKGSTSKSALMTCIAAHRSLPPLSSAWVSALPTYAVLRKALDDDVEAVPYSVFGPRVRNFFAYDLPAALAEPDWTDLDWHVDGRCSGCVFAGFDWNGWKDAHCIPTAEREGHLSLVAYVSRGASVALKQGGVTDIGQLASLSPTDAVFDRHQALRASRTVIADRVKALQLSQGPGPASQSGTSAVMPKYANLKFFITAHFDPSSAITVAFGLEARWVEPYARHKEREQQHGPGITWETHTWKAQVWVVPSKDTPDDEAKQLIALLERIKEIIDEARSWDAGQNRTTTQFYLWDQLEVKHFSRVMGRHLETVLDNGDVAHLAWLFPTEEVLPNPGQISQKSPLTVVSDVVRSVLAAPVSHVYSLLPVARVYHPPWRGTGPAPSWWGTFKVHPLFEDPFSDQIPAERIHEIWSRSTIPPWAQTQAQLVEAVERRLSALMNVTNRLSDDLKGVLIANAPISAVGAMKPLDRVGFDGQLWFAFAKLNSALDELEILRTRAMPPHEREARFRSALLEEQLQGAHETAALQLLGLSRKSGRRVYRLAAKSKEVKLRVGDFSVALAPVNRPNFLDETYDRVVAGTSLAATASGPTQWQRMDKLCSVNVVGLDRENALLAVDPGFMNQGTTDALEIAGVVDFSRNVMLDPVPGDFFTKPLRETLRAIGNPPLAASNPVATRVKQAIGQTKRRRGARGSADTPVAEVLWAANQLHQDRQPRQLAQYRQAIGAAGFALTNSQWDALEESLQRKLSLIWGPPGTGKSETVRALLLVAMLDSIANGRPLRVLLTAGTYGAVDNILLPFVDEFPKLFPPGADFEVHRLRSSAGSAPVDRRAKQIDREVSKMHPSPELVDLRARLTANAGITLVAGTTQQAHNLLVTNDAGNDSAQQELFDLIALDEASQVDVAHAILALASRASDGQVVFAGDNLQLDPIHQAEAPLGLDAMVGSVYNFMHDHHKVAPQMLSVNYRSNDTMVRFARHAGYDATLQAHAPDLRLQMTGHGHPAGWPSSLLWTPEWESMLDPEQPATSFIYADTRWSSQWNLFEADAVAALLVILRGRQLDQLANDPSVGVSAPPAALWDDRGFWRDGVGVVTPHRAQQALIVNRLQHVFPQTDPVMLRGAVDTVERFQGQQRQVIIASYALGDPDAIRDEEEFLMSLNRFNVMASRARAKFIVLVSQAVIDHLAGDIDVLRHSGLLKTYIATFCEHERPMQLSYLDGANRVDVPGQFRWAT